MTVGARIQLRRDTAANWTSANPILALAEPGYEKDTGKEKRGDGVTAWNSLPYHTPGTGTFAPLTSPALTGTPTVNGAQVEDRSHAAATYVPTFPVAATVGDGTAAQTTAAIQAVIDTAAASITGNVKAAKVVLVPRLYVLASAGTKTVLNAGGSTNSQPYCLSIPSGVTLSGRGATLRANEATALIMNANPSLTTDHDLGWEDVTLDGNNYQLTNTGLVVLTGTTRPMLKRVKVINGTRVGLLIYNNDDGVYDEINVDGFAGDPVTFGMPYAGKTERHPTIGKVYSKNVVSDAVDSFSFTGQVCYFSVTSGSVESVQGKNCVAGVKFQYGSDLSVGRVVLDGGGDNGGHGGLKFQQGATRVTVAQATVTDGGGPGCYIDSTTIDCCVVDYVGKGNASLATYPDVWLDGTRPRIGRLKSINAAYDAVEVRSTAVDYRLGEVFVLNTGQVGGSANSVCAGLFVAGGSGRVESLTCIDDQATKTANRGIAISAPCTLHVGAFKHSGSASGPFNLWSTATDVIVLNPRLGTDNPLGEATLTASATTTTITNNNITINGTIHPILEVVPANAAAQSLGMPRVTYAAGVATLRHSAAVGGEIYAWRVVGYRKSAALPA